MQFQSLLTPVSEIARQAGAAIMQVYAGSAIEVLNKEDSSPLTEADMAAHHLIVAGLQRLTPELPVLSEEAAGISWELRRQWTRYWLVDPLDGTREFIKRNGEFTVNIALVEAGVPVLGVVYAPVLDCMYSGVQGLGAYKTAAGLHTQIHASTVSASQKKLKVVASRTHRGPALDAWLHTVTEHFPQLETLSMGSSLKICLVAEGKADIYPRLSPTSEWDTAAAQAVLEAAGGRLLDSSWKPYRYNRKESLLNPDFFALGAEGYDFSALAD